MKTGSVKFNNAIWDEIREIKLYGTFQNDLYFQRFDQDVKY